MTVILYGIANCDTIRKARAWLATHDVVHRFHDYKKLGVTPAMLAGWADAVGWEALLNRSGTTFRGLSETERSGIDRDRAMALMVAHPSLIKRPVMEHAGGVLVGFKPEIYESVLH